MTGKDSITKKIARQDSKAPRNPIHPGPDSLRRLQGMAWTKRHEKQLFAVLLLREVKLLRESEGQLQAQIVELKNVISSRCDKQYRVSSSRGNNTEETDNLHIVELVSSLLGVDGVEGHNIESSDDGVDCADENDDESDDSAMAHSDSDSTRPSAVSTVDHGPGTSRVSAAPPSNGTVRPVNRIGPQPGYRRCLLCAHAISNDNCPGCAVMKYNDTPLADNNSDK